MQVGVGGSLWYAMAIVLSILMFAALCVRLKTRAPGAKTFPQVGRSLCPPQDAEIRGNRVPQLFRR